MKFIVGFMCLIHLAGCAVLHHAQLGDIDNRRANSSSKIDIKLSETGVNLDEAAAVLRRLGNKSFRKTTDDAATYLGMIQMGPRTGNPVYISDYARPLIELLWEQCPSGRIANLMAVRETRKYPVVSGEIVKITGDCLK